MSSLTQLSIFVGIFAAFLIMVEKHFPDQKPPLEFDDLSDELKAWRAKGKTVEIDGRNMFVIEEGSGQETLIFIHGFPTSSFDYARSLQYFTQSHKVVLFDHIGFGFSDKPNQVRILFITYVLQWTPLLVATSGPALSGHSNRWLLYQAVF